MPLHPPVDLLNPGGDTLWANLGDWSAAGRYPEAAGDLARHLAERAGLAPGDRVLDVGCGAGDQIRVWIQEYAVAEVTAMEQGQRQAQRAAARAEEWGLDGRVHVVVGDAASDPPPQLDVDAVLALDSAYFFRPRSAFLQRARTALRPGGVLALTDLVLGTGRPAGISRLLAPACGVPSSNLLRRDQWIAGLQDAGFEDVTVEDRTAAVLEGFARWVGGPDRPPSYRATDPGWMALAAFGATLGRLARSGGIGYAVITARTPRG